MRNLRTLGKQLFHSPLSCSLSFLLSLSLTAGFGNVVRAESPTTAPPELKEIIEEIENASNNRDLKELMQFYSREYTNSDGLTHSALSDALKAMWRRYYRLKYRTELLSWERVGEQLVAETVTSIRGIKREQGRLIRLNSTIRSRQYFQNQKLVRQEILAERNKLTSGKNPPQVEVKLPEKVRVGEQFNFDVIVKQPLGDDLLLGTAMEEKTSGDLYLNPSTLELDLLAAGGIFKLVKAPLIADNRWFSAILVREDGITLITQRVIIEE
ncbi:MAG: nuclear transport factor 2 family protein [Moorea sp. SIO2B7]|nr:nuclear transport factor 2 family protein [Moorena sp. SIO2B7]